MAIAGLLLFAVFAFIWYYPIYRKKTEENRPDKKLFWKAFFMGLVPAFLIGLILPFIMGWVARALGAPDDGLLHKILVSAIGYGIGEEVSKFIICFLVLKKAGYRNKAHTTMLFGAVGLGFGVFESVLAIGTSGPAGAVIRGIFCLHVFFQFWMGMYYAEYVEKTNEGDTAGAKKALVLAFAVPMIVHAIHDVIGSMGLDYITVGEADPNKALAGLIMFLAAVVIDMVFVITTYIRTKKL